MGEACYTDGSKTQERVRAGIYGVKPRVRILLNFGNIVTVFQTEVATTEHYAGELLRLKSVNRQSIHRFDYFNYKHFCHHASNLLCVLIRSANTP